MTNKRSGRTATSSADGRHFSDLFGTQDDAGDKFFRKSLFKQINIASGGTMRALDALLESLSAAAAKGDVGAIKHLDLVANHRLAMAAKREVIAAREASTMGARLRKQQRVTAIAVPFATVLYLQLLPEIVAHFERSHGPFDLRSAYIPYYVDLDLARLAFDKVGRRLKRQRRGQPYEVGYRKPPSGTRFTSENNPATRRRATNSWEALDRGLAKPVIIKLADGGQASSTRAQVSYDQLIRRAIAGDRAARAVVLERVFALEREGKLSPSVKRRRRRRFVLDEKATALLANAKALGTAWIRRDMMAHFARNLGSAKNILDVEAQVLGTEESSLSSASSQQPRVPDVCDEPRQMHLTSDVDLHAPSRPPRIRKTQLQAPTASGYVRRSKKGHLSSG